MGRAVFAKWDKDRKLSYVEPEATAAEPKAYAHSPDSDDLQYGDEFAALRDGEEWQKRTKSGGGVLHFVKRWAHWQAGDVMLAKNLKGDPVPALVHSVLWHRLETRGVWIPMWRVRLRTAKGGWSNSWTQVFPGDVQRAYHAAGHSVGLDKKAAVA